MSNSSSDPSAYHCTGSRPAVLLSSYWAAIKYALVFPLSVFVLCVARERRRPQRSVAASSHADVLTYHMAAMELVGAAGVVFYCGGVFAHVGPLLLLGVLLILFSFPAQILIHCLTCVDRYLAVVHPIAYMKLKQTNGVRIRNVSVFVVWLLCVGFICVQVSQFPEFPIIPFCCFLICALILVSYCSVSVLSVLIRPGPRDLETDRVDQSKRKAFNTITAILAMLCFWLVGFIICIALYMSPTSVNADNCLIFMAGLWFNIPSSLVSPLLFLKREGKLRRCRRKNPFRFSCTNNV